MDRKLLILLLVIFVCGFGDTKSGSGSRGGSSGSKSSGSRSTGSSKVSSTGKGGHGSGGFPLWAIILVSVTSIVVIVLCCAGGIASACSGEEVSKPEERKDLMKPDGPTPDVNSANPEPSAPYAGNPPPYGTHTAEHAE